MSFNTNLLGFNQIQKQPTQLSFQPQFSLQNPQFTSLQNNNILPFNLQTKNSAMDTNLNRSSHLNEQYLNQNSLGQYQQSGILGHRYPYSNNMLDNFGGRLESQKNYGLFQESSKLNNNNINNTLFSSKVNFNFDQQFQQQQTQQIYEMKQQQNVNYLQQHSQIYQDQIKKLQQEIEQQQQLLLQQQLLSQSKQQQQSPSIIYPQQQQYQQLKLKNQLQSSQKDKSVTTNNENDEEPTLLHIPGENSSTGETYTHHQSKQKSLSNLQQNLNNIQNTRQNEPNSQDKILASECENLKQMLESMKTKTVIESQTSISSTKKREEKSEKKTQKQKKQQSKETGIEKQQPKFPQNQLQLSQELKKQQINKSEKNSCDSKNLPSQQKICQGFRKCAPQKSVEDLENECGISNESKKMHQKKSILIHKII